MRRFTRAEAKQADLLVSYRPLDNGGVAHATATTHHADDVAGRRAAVRDVSTLIDSIVIDCHGCSIAIAHCTVRGVTHHTDSDRQHRDRYVIDDECA